MPHLWYSAMMVVPLIIALVFLSLPASPAAHGADDDIRKRLLAPPTTSQSNYDAPDIQTIAQSCMTCHGYDGDYQDGSIPAIHGLDSVFLNNRLLALRDGREESTIMKRLLIPFSDEDIQALAQYFGR